MSLKWPKIRSKFYWKRKKKKQKTQPHRVEHMLKKKRGKNFKHNMRDMTCERRDKWKERVKKL